MEHAANWAYLATPAIIPSRKKPPELAIGNKDKNGLVPGGEAISYLHAHQFQTTAAEGGGGGDGNTGSSRSRTGSGRATAEESHGGAVLPVPDAVSFSSFFRFMAGTIPESGQILGVQRERRLDKGKDMSEKNDDEDQSGGDGGSTKTTARGPASPRVIEEQSRARGRDKKRGSSRDVASHRVRTPAVDADDGATPFSPHRRGDDVLKHRQGTGPVDWDRDGVETGSSPMASTMGSISTGTGTGTGANASASASVRTSTTAISQRGKEAEAVATAECSNADDGCKSTEKGGGAQGSAGTTNDPSRGSSFARARARPPVDSIAAFVLASGGRAAAVRRGGGGGGAAAAAAATGASAAASASPAVRAAPQAVPPAVLSAVPGRTTTVGRQPRPPTTPSLPASSRSPAKKRDHDPPPLHQQQQHQQQQPYHRRSPPSPHHHHRNHIHTRAPSLSSSFPTSFSSSLALSWSSSLVAGPPTAAATATTGAAVALADSPPCDTETETETHFKRHPPVLAHAAAQNPPNRHVGGGHGHRLTRQLHNTHQHHQVPSTSTASSTRTHRIHVPRSPLATPPVSSSPPPPPPPPSPAPVASASGTAVVFSSPASLPGTGYCYQPSPDTSTTTTTTNNTTSTDLLTAEPALPANTTSTTAAAAAACVSIRRVTTTQATAYPHLRFHSPTTTTAPAKSEQPPRAPPPLITSPRLFPLRHAAAAAMTPDEQYRADSVSSASVTTHSNVGVMTSSDTLPPSSTEGSIAASNASTSAKPRLAVGPKPLVIRNNRTYISDANLAYPLPVDLAELHRQSLRTLLLFQLFGGPITSPAFAAKPPARVLEVGCGSGFWSMMCHRYFDQHGHGSISFTGLDIVPLCGSGLDPNSKPDKDMRWRFVQHDMRRTPWPLDDGEFDLVMVKDMSFAGPGQIAQRFMDEYLRVLRPGGVLEVWDSDHTIRMLRPHAPPNRAPGATVEEADEDEDEEDEDEEEDSSDDNEEGSESDNGDEDHVTRLGAYPVTGNTPLSTPLNPFLVEYNGWLSKALDARALSAVPCTMTGPALLQEDGLGDVRSKRLAIPLSEVRWEREGVGGVVTKDGKTYIDSQKGKTKVGDTKAARGGKSLTLAQAAVRRTALETCVGMIQALEPLLRESSGKSQDEWDGWVGKMINDLLQQGGTSWGECLEIGAWTARKRK